MGLYFWAKDFLSRPAGGAATRILAAPLAGLAWGYARVLALRRWAYRKGHLRAFRAGVPVISVGNLTAGGTGKTPCVETICRWLLAEGVRPAVVARGYGGTLRDSWATVSDGSRLFLDYRVAGDEAVLLGRRLGGVPVLIGADRRIPARMAVERCGAEVLVLDDGFQHLRLARDLDLVTLDARAPFGNEYCFPRGLLRESPQALADADMVLLTRTRRENSRRLEIVRTEVGRYNPDAPVLKTAHRPLGVVRLPGDEPEPLETLQGMKVLAFAAIGSPEAFFEELKSLGAQVLEAVPFPDHHVYAPGDLAQLSRWAGLMNAEALLTTEKDAVRLAEMLPLERPLLALRIEMAVFEGAELLRQAVLETARNGARRRAPG